MLIIYFLIFQMNPHPEGGMDKGSGANHLLAVYDINAFGCVPADMS